MTLFEELQDRGIVKQSTDESLDRVLATEPVTLYAGFDPTADALHVGSLLPLLTLRRFQLAGHRPIAVVGGATGLIGDPSGKTHERQLLAHDVIAKNVNGIRTIIERILDFNGPNAAQIVNNADWFNGLSYIDFLRDIGKHFTINHMMAKESVRIRLEDREHGISYTEFSYMLIQAYDFFVLNREKGCRLQIGGSDQWGNITAGCELIRRMNSAEGKGFAPIFGLTHPLVMKADGTKFGKTEQGTIWLDPEKTSPYQFYQFFIQTSDADVGTFLRYFTFLPLEQIQRLESLVKTAPEKREAQKALATEMTVLIHGQSALENAQRVSQALFGTEIRDLDRNSLLEVLRDAPSWTTSKSRLQPGLPLIDALVESGLCASKGAARKEIQGGGVYLNNVRATDVNLLLKTADLIAQEFAVLRRGKKNYQLIVFE